MPRRALQRTAALMIRLILLPVLADIETKYTQHVDAVDLIVDDACSEQEIA